MSCSRLGHLSRFIPQETVTRIVRAELQIGLNEVGHLGIPVISLELNAVPAISGIRLMTEMLLLEKEKLSRRKNAPSRDVIGKSGELIAVILTVMIGIPSVEGWRFVILYIHTVKTMSNSSHSSGRKTG